MPRIDIYNTKGEKSGKLTLPKEIFAASVNKYLIAQAVRVYLSNQRKARAKSKSRGQVQGSGRKIYRQKGTGRARHGDRYAPIFVGGGIAHGPKGIENWQLKMPKKMKRLALFSALTDKLKEKEIIVVEGLEKVKPKTKAMVKVIQNLKLKMKNGRLRQKVLLILPQTIESVSRASRNIAKLKLIQADLLNPYEVLKGGKLVLTKPAVKVIKETFLKS